MPEAKIQGWWTKAEFYAAYRKKYPGQTVQAKIEYEWDRFSRLQEEWTKDDWVFFLDLFDSHLQSK